MFPSHERRRRRPFKMKRGSITHRVLYVYLPVTVTLVCALSCQEMLEFPDERQITLNELKATKPEEIVDCLAHLGKSKLPMDVTDYIWQTIVKVYETAGQVPDKVMALLHWVTPALTPDEYSNISLSNIDVITNFGLDYQLSPAQLAAIADRVREDFAGKQPEDYTFYDLTAMRQVLCAFNRSEIERIRPSAFREAAGVLGKLNGCPLQVMQGFAFLAVQPTGFGDPAGWFENTVEALGAIADYVPEVAG